MSTEGAVTVSCNQHGTMTYDQEMGWWTCSGWAGEGCLTGMITTKREVIKAAYGGGEPPGARITVGSAPEGDI